MARLVVKNVYRERPHLMTRLENTVIILCSAIREYRHRDDLCRELLNSPHFLLMPPQSRDMGSLHE